MNMQVSGPIDIYGRQSRLRAKDQTTTASQIAVWAFRVIPFSISIYKWEPFHFRFSEMHRTGNNSLPPQWGMAQ